MCSHWLWCLQDPKIACFLNLISLNIIHLYYLYFRSLCSHNHSIIVNVINSRKYLFIYTFQKIMSWMQHSIILYNKFTLNTPVFKQCPITLTSVITQERYITGHSSNCCWWCRVGIGKPRPMSLIQYHMVLYSLQGKNNFCSFVMSKNNHTETHHAHLLQNVNIHFIFSLLYTWCPTKNMFFFLN